MFLNLNCRPLNIIVVQNIAILKYFGTNPFATSKISMAICHMWQVSFGLNNAVLNAYVDLGQKKAKICRTKPKK